MASLSDYFDAVDTGDGTAVAADIAEGKIAYVNGVRLVGTKGAASGVLLELINPTGITAASYNPASEHGAVLRLDPDCGALASVGTWSLDSSGYAQNANSYARFANLASLPAYTTRRKYEIWGKTKDAALTNDYGIEICFNFDSASFNDGWKVHLRWLTGTGVYELRLRRVDATVHTDIATANSTTGMDVPMNWYISVVEQGDGVVVQACLYEDDLVTDDEALSIGYTVGSRPYKAQTYTNFRARSTAGDEWLIRGCRISDLL